MLPTSLEILLKSFPSFPGLFLSIKTITKLDLGQGETFEIKIKKISRRGSRGSSHIPLNLCWGVAFVKYDHSSHDKFILEDIPVIPDLEDVQEEDMMTKIAAPPRCVIDILYWNLFQLVLYCVKKIPPRALTYARHRPRPATQKEFENRSFTLKTH